MNQETSFWRIGLYILLLPIIVPYMVYLIIIDEL